MHNTMSQTKSYERQTVFDLSLQQYGSIEGAFDLMLENPNAIPSLDAIIAPGSKIKSNAAVINKDVQSFYNNEKRHPVSLANGESQLFNEFNSEFNFEFR